MDHGCPAHSPGVSEPMPWADLQLTNLGSKRLCLLDHKRNRSRMHTLPCYQIVDVHHESLPTCATNRMVNIPLRSLTSLSLSFNSAAGFGNVKANL